MADAAAGAIPAPRLGTKLIYGFGSIAFGIKDGGFSFFLVFFYSQVLGLPASLVSLAVALAIIADAVIDPVIGQLSDGWRSRLGRRHPFMYAAAVPIAVFYFLLWNPPHWSGGALLGYLLGMAILVRAAIAFYEIPSSALAPELSPDYNQRTSLMAYRWLFGALGNGVMLAVAVVFFLPTTKAHPIGMLYRPGYFYYALAAALAMAASILVSAAGTHRLIRYFRKADAAARPTLLQLAREMARNLSHRSLIMVTLAGLFGGMATGLGAVLSPFFVNYFWVFTSAQLSVLGIAALLATGLAVPLASFASARLEKKRGFIVTAFASLFVNNIAMTLKLLGLLPPGGSNALLLIFFVSTVVGLALAITSGILVSSMIADVVEDSEIRTGKRSEGLFSASLSFVSKATSGLGIIAGGVLIDAVGFPRNAAPAAMAQLGPPAIHHLVLIYMPLQIVLWGIAISLVTGYRIDRRTHEDNLSRLAGAAAMAQASPAAEIVAGG